MTTVDKYAVTPLCIRFKVEDVEKVKKYAVQNKLKYHSTWIREVALSRAEKVLEKASVPVLQKFETANGYGKQICIRFSREDMTLIRRAAIIEGSFPSPWIRAIVMYYVGV